MEYIFCRNPLSYEEILGWRGFSFEQSHELKKNPAIRSIEALALEVDNGTYGIEESERIISNVVSKQKGY